MWFTESGANKIGRIDPQGVLHEYAVPTPSSQPYGITASPIDGTAWFTEFGSSRIGHVDLAGAITEIATPTPDSGPAGIATSPDGFGACFAASLANRIGCVVVSPALAIHEFAIPTPDGAPQGVTLGQDGAVWFTEYEGDAIGRLSDGVITEFRLPEPGSGAWAITASYSSSEPIWFTERRKSRVGFITAEGRITEYSFPGSGDPLGIAADSEKAWFTDGGLATMRPDALILSGVGRVGSWQTSFAIGNPTDHAAALLHGPGISRLRVPVRASAASTGCLWTWPPMRLCGRRTRIRVRSQEDHSRTSRARSAQADCPQWGPASRTAARRGQSADVPVQRLSDLTAVDPGVLAFPSVSSGPGIHSNLTLANLGDGPTLEAVVEAFRPDGTALGSKTVSIFHWDWLVLPDVLGLLGAGAVDNAQVRVTRTSGDLFWGALAVIRDDEGTLSMASGSNLAGTDDAVLVGGAGVAGAGTR